MPPTRDVVAQVIFKDAKGLEVREASRTGWLNHNFDTIDLIMNQTQCVILLMQKDAHLFVPYYRREPDRSSGFPGESIISDELELQGSIPTAELRLIVRDQNLLIRPVIFDLLYENGLPVARAKFANAEGYAQ